MAVYTAIDNPELYFQVKLYTGNNTAIGSGGLATTFDGDTDMQPDLVWIKARADSESHKLYDSVRGVTKDLESDLNTAENTNTEGLTAFGSDGFTIGNYSSINASTQTYVAWCWKESATAGFDIVSYTGNDTVRTISHSLSAVPKVIMPKARSTSGYEWRLYHAGNTSAPETDYLVLNDTSATTDAANAWNDTAPTSSVFTLGDGETPNNDGTTYITYLWAEKQGFSKVGKYTGNGNADGPFIHLGFRPAFFLLKKSSATDPWVIFDNKRAPYNYFDKLIYPDSNEAESGAAERGDFLSNGVKFKSNHTYFNGSGITYVYMAFAEAPFVNSNGVPCNAR